MTAVSPLVFPRGRTLAGWWKQLAHLQPQALWVGHLLLHRVEALAALHLLSRLDSLSLFVLRAVALTGPGTLPDLNARLHLGLPLLRELLRFLERAQLVCPDDGGSWSLTALGRQGIQQGSYMRPRNERRTFYFVESQQPARPPHFLKFQKETATLASPGVDGWHFEPALLQACIQRPVEWKQRFGFPQEVQQIFGTDTEEAPALPSTQTWQRIVLDRVERLVAALVLAPAAPATGNRERLFGFAVKLEGWELQAGEPVFVLDADWQDVFPELAEDPSLDQWRQAWREWCQPRGLPAAEVDACVVERHGSRLRVLAPPHLVERLRAARSDVFKGEAWLLAGTARLREAAVIELVELQGERSRHAHPTV
jgi:hypothetical protein